MINELVAQYEHTWRTFAGVVGEFEAQAWLRLGFGSMTPVRTAFHILKGVKYYIGDESCLTFVSGMPFDLDLEKVAADNLPSQADMLAMAAELGTRTREWLAGIDLEAPNQAFPWAGNSQLGVALFLLRHNLYHIGELSALLNQSKNGVAQDHWVQTL
jgi:hypothetical protein